MPPEYAVLQLALPGRAVQNIGVFVLDPSTGELDFKLREDWDEIADPEDAELLSELENDFDVRTREVGGRAFLEALEDSLSNALRLTPRRWAGRRTLGQLFSDHVGATHEVYTLKAAATKFGEEWETPGSGTPDEFVAQVVGRSMEPLIPDGSLCLFRKIPAGSRQNKIVLIERGGGVPESSKYTVKKYVSRKVQISDEEWRHERIMAVPLNPEFDAFELREEDKVLAEFVRVVD
jgi:hypothetical protein